MMQLVQLLELVLSLLTLLLVVHVAVVHGQSSSTTTTTSSCGDFAPPAEIYGKKFFNSYTGAYIAIKGISYYPRPNEGELTVTNSIDYYSEEHRHIWERDIEHFKDLHINAIRLYAVDPGLNHDAFMCALKSAGIYVLVGLAADCYRCAILTDAPPPLCYPPELKSRGEFIIQQFSKYENVLAFSAGNEVSLSSEGGQHSLENAPCQKKFLRDMRAYVNRCSSTMRKIPIGVIEADVERVTKALYYNCRSSSSSSNTNDDDDELENADFIGINSYLHCDGTATSLDQLVGYNQLLEDYAALGLTVPVMWTEHGCLNESFETIDGYENQRNFLQVEALYSDEFREQFTGGFVFEYSTEKALSQDTSPHPFREFGPQNAGVGYFEPEMCDDITTPCDYVRFPQFETLANRYKSADTSNEPNSVFYKRTWNNPSPPQCPKTDDDDGGEFLFPPLDSFTWPSDSTELQACPVEVPVFCPGIPTECNVVTLAPVASSSSSPWWKQLLLSATTGVVLGSTIVLEALLFW